MKSKDIFAIPTRSVVFSVYARIKLGEIVERPCCVFLTMEIETLFELANSTLSAKTETSIGIESKGWCPNIED